MAKPTEKQTDKKSEKKSSKKAEKIVSPIGILTWASVYEPDDKTFNNQEKNQTPKFKATLLVTKKKDTVKGVACEEDLRPLKQACLRAAQEEFGKDTKFKDLETPFNDGDEYYADKNQDAKEGEEKYKYLKDRIFFTAKSKFKPGVCDAKLEPLGDGEDVASGDYVRLSITPYAYEREAQMVVNGKKVKQKIKGVSFSLENIQKIHQGKRFEGERDATRDFDEVKGVEFDTEEDEDLETDDKATDDSEFESSEGADDDII